MTDMTPAATTVLHLLQTNNKQPEDVFLENWHEMHDTWDDTKEFTGTPESYRIAFDQNRVLATLFGSKWVGEQYKKIERLQAENPDIFVCKRAPKGMPQWEFDLLGGQEGN